MNPENLKESRTEIEQIKSKLFSTNLIELLQNSSISEGVEFQIKILQENQVAIEVCGLKFTICPCGKHPQGKCFHPINCDTKQPIC